MNETQQLPPVIPVSSLAAWLPEIFPEGTPNRTYVVREISAKTLFVLLYVGAVEGAGRHARPDQITKMSDAQAARTDAASREAWSIDTLGRGAVLELQQRWYAPNTREPIRDETLRLGLVALGAVIERGDLPTTSAKPRYALSRHFADLLFKLAAHPEDASALIQQWQGEHLNTAALNRIVLLRRATVASNGADRVTVTFPNGESRLMRPGPSTTITKAVVEVFAARFLQEPGVVFVSESGEKVVARDDELAAAMGLHLDYGKNLPDVILADVAAARPRLVFVEVVATDGPINEQRKVALLEVASQARIERKHVYFVSAFSDRSASAFRKLVSEIAWGTHAWFMSEPEKLMTFSEAAGEPGSVDGTVVW
jgi:hypothetical protein